MLSSLTLLKTNKGIKIIQQFFLIILLFSIIFDPVNSHFKIKTISFFIFLLTCVGEINGQYIPIVLGTFIIYFVSYAHALLIGTWLDSGIASWNLNSFLFLIMLLFIQNKDLHYLKYLYYISLIFSYWIVFLVIFALIPTPISDFAIRSIYGNDDFIMFGFREVYGIPYFCLYYRTASIVIIPLGISLVLYDRTNKKKYLLHSLLFFLELFLSGARANMISGLMVIIFHYIIKSFYIKKRMVYSIFLFLTLFTIGFYICIKLVLEKEGSNVVKAGHMKSFMELFSENPLRYLFIGSGPGTMMYTYAKGKYVGLTELSYFELIKNYGFIGTLYIIGSFIYPIILMLNNHRDKLLKLMVFISYLGFFLIAATNPLFTGSTGFTTVITVFYLLRIDISKEFNIRILK